jgi:hypothetical protein
VAQTNNETRERLPQRLPAGFVWSSSGLKHVEYSNGETFEGTFGTFLGQDELGEGGQATVSVVYVKDHAVARKRMRAEGIDQEARREALMLENIVHRHVSIVFD